MYIAHQTQSPYVGVSGYVHPYGFPLPNNGMGGLGGLSTGELGLAALAIGGLYWFMKKRRHRR